MRKKAPRYLQLTGSLPGKQQLKLFTPLKS